MPIYEYRCNQCGEISEIMIGIGSRSDVLQCKNCSSVDIERILSTSAFTLKNGGHQTGNTCCGRDERCDSPPCSTGDSCRRG
ncbi:MAG: zinc ribbon domain-containing protein [Thermodesulfobacteriota bacterium]|nr:zinc ribbon domain-containing protein [Thermodesulfobacteriota bacterium]